MTLKKFLRVKTFKDCIYFTSVDAGEFPSEVDKCWKFIHTVFFRVSRVVHFDKRDVQSICLVIYFLQTFNHLIALNAIVLNCERIFKRV